MTSWISPSDVPNDIINIPNDAVTVFDLSIDQEGHPVGCSIVKTSGLKSFDVAACAAFMRRGKFNPARDQEGKPIASAIRQQIGWASSCLSPQGSCVGGRNAPDFTFGVKALPDGRKRALVTVRELVSTSGMAEACDTTLSSGNEVIDRLACKMLSTNLHDNMIVDREGRPTRGTRLREVEFVSSVSDRAD
jgi:hypothetical protein